MILACVCGRRFRTQKESETQVRNCPQCGAALHPECDALVPTVDIGMLLSQMKVLREELVARDRQLRKAQAESTVLKAELEQLRARFAGVPSQDTTPAPLARVEKAAVPARELPSNRVPMFTARDP